MAQHCAAYLEDRLVQYAAKLSQTPIFKDWLSDKLFRKCTMLLHQAHAIHQPPMLHNVTIHHTDNNQNPNGNGLAGSRNAHKIALVRTRPCYALGDPITFSHDIIHRGGEVREGRTRHQYDLFEPSRPAGTPGGVHHVRYSLA